MGLTISGAVGAHGAQGQGRHSPVTEVREGAKCVFLLFCIVNVLGVTTPLTEGALQSWAATSSNALS